MTGPGRCARVAVARKIARAKAAFKNTIPNLLTTADVCAAAGVTEPPAGGCAAAHPAGTCSAGLPCFCPLLLGAASSGSGLRVRLAVGSRSRHDAVGCASSAGSPSSLLLLVAPLVAALLSCVLSLSLPDASSDSESAPKIHLQQP